MPTKRCCCEKGCDIADDNFDRADSTNLGAKWVEISGDWAIASTKLTVPTVGIVRNVATSPYGGNNLFAFATVENYVDDTKYRILVQMNEDGTEYYFGEWHYVDSDTMYFSVGDETGVFESIGPEAPITEGAQIRVTMNDHNQLCMSDTSSRITVCVAPKPESTHKWAGLAADTANGATFDNFLLKSTTAESVDCDECDCTCDNWCIPDLLVLTIQDLNECPYLDGFEIDLTNTNPIKFGDGWITASVNCPSNPGGIEPLQFKFQCNEAFGLLTLLTGSPTPSLNLGDATVSTCNPISIRFGPFSYGSVSGCFFTTCCGGNPCGSGPGDESLFYVWLTEKAGPYDY